MHVSLFQSAWQKLEKKHKKIYKSDFPNCVKTLLFSAGYDRNSNLASLNAEKIEEIEKHLNLDKDIIENLDCCYSEEYKKLNEFRFLPGHKALILMIPDLIGVSKNVVTDHELKSSLIKKLMTACAKAGAKLPAGTISEANLLEFHRTTKEKDTVCQCTFSCPFCSKTYTIKYKTFWMTNNAWKHLKSGHIEKK